MTITPAAVKAELVTLLGTTADALRASGPSRGDVADLGRAVFVRVLMDEAGLSVREAAFAAGFRCADSARVLLDMLDNGDFDDSPALPSKFGGDPQALITELTSAMEPIST